VYVTPVASSVDHSDARASLSTAPAIPATPPCVSAGAFFPDGLGDRADVPVLVWHRDGERETAFVIDPEKDTLKIRPSLSFSTQSLSSAQSVRFRLKIRTHLGLSNGRTRPNYFVLGSGKGPDDRRIQWLFSASNGQNGMGELVQEPTKRWDWQFYAFEDSPELRTHCRGK
jgi:hypothetical protein